jgi:hypothetical protein
MHLSRPYTPDLIDALDRLDEELRDQAKPLLDGVRPPLPGGDPALLEATAGAATILSRLLSAITAFDHGEDDNAEALIEGIEPVLHDLRSNLGY